MNKSIKFFFPKPLSNDDKDLLTTFVYALVIGLQINRINLAKLKGFLQNSDNFFTITQLNNKFVIESGAKSKQHLLLLKYNGTVIAEQLDHKNSTIIYFKNLYSQIPKKNLDKLSLKLPDAYVKTFQPNEISPIVNLYLAQLDYDDSSGNLLECNSVIENDDKAVVDNSSQLSRSNSKEQILYYSSNFSGKDISKQLNFFNNNTINNDEHLKNVNCTDVIESDDESSVENSSQLSSSNFQEQILYINGDLNNKNNSEQINLLSSSTVNNDEHLKIVKYTDVIESDDESQNNDNINVKILPQKSRSNSGSSVASYNSISHNCLNTLTFSYFENSKKDDDCEGEKYVDGENLGFVFV